jgi:4-hydroxy 2-oxovalerate aldolase
MYVTDFRTEDAVKQPIMKKLKEAGVEIIECGFLESTGGGDNTAVYSTVESITPFLPEEKGDTLFTAIVMHYENLPVFPRKDEAMVDCIRVAFFKRFAEDALRAAEDILEKGFKVMFQPSRTTDYSEEELRDLLRRMNGLAPYSVAIVDTFGNLMPEKAVELMRLYADTLDSRVRIDFHFHNNYQLAFANTIAVMGEVPASRDIIFDASVFGMGRGAGNLPLELLMEWLNARYGTGYDVRAIFELYEEYIAGLYEKTPWGYSIRHLVSAMHNCNPYYATYLTKAHALSETQIAEVIGDMTDDQKINFYKSIADACAERLTARRTEGA